MAFFSISGLISGAKNDWHAVVAKGQEFVEYVKEKMPGHTVAYFSDQHKMTPKKLSIKFAPEPVKENISPKVTSGTSKRFPVEPSDHFIIVLKHADGTFSSLPPDQPVVPCPGNSPPRGTFPPNVVAAAQHAHSIWPSVPISVTLAQWVLESAWGGSMPIDSNNPFGIKAVARQSSVIASTSEVVEGQTIPVQARFRKYDSIEDAFDDHGRLLSTNDHYQHARTFSSNPDAFADALTGKYATDPNYGTKLKNIMVRYNLYQYDATPSIGQDR